MGEQRLTARVRGQVQGVGFRYATASAARSLRLAGTATNCPDRTVEVVVEGDRERCEQLLGWLRSDAAPGRVDDVEIAWSSAQGLRGFATR